MFESWSERTIEVRTNYQSANREKRNANTNKCEHLTVKIRELAIFSEENETGSDCPRKIEHYNLQKHFPKQNIDSLISKINHFLLSNEF